MQPVQSKSNYSERQLIGWLILGPFLAVWPILSALPIFSLLGGSGSYVYYGAQVMLLASGFWGFLGLVIVTALCMTPDMRGKFRGYASRRLYLLVYATLWTGLYFAATQWLK